MNADARATALLASLILLIGVDGCVSEEWLTSDPQIGNDRISSPAGRLQDKWIGHDVSDLVSVIGEPDAILEATPKGVPFRDGKPANSYVYYHRSEPGDNCIDAYVVSEESGEIINYFCR